MKSIDSADYAKVDPNYFGNSEDEDTIVDAIQQEYFHSHPLTNLERITTRLIARSVYVPFYQLFYALTTRVSTRLTTRSVYLTTRFVYAPDCQVCLRP